jgi:hypothetical protein
MEAPYSVLKLAYGATEVDLLRPPDARGAHLAKGGYAPGVHRRRTGRAGGLGTHLPVEETITINIDGESAAACHATVRAIAAILDMADAEADPGGGLLKARLICQPRGSMEPAPLIGFLLPSERDDLLNLPATYSDRLMAYEINGLRIRLRRMPWVGADETSDPSAAVTLPAVVSAGWASSRDIPSPMQLSLSTNLMDSIPDGLPPSVLLVANSASRLAVMEAEDANGVYSGLWSNVTDTDRNASNGQIVRFSPITIDGVPETTFQYGPVMVLPSAFVAQRNTRVACYAVLRTTGPFEVGWSAGPEADSRFMVDIPATAVDAARHRAPSIVYLGTAVVDDGVAGMRLRARSIAATAATAGRLELDYLALLGLDDVTSRAIVIDRAGRLAFAGTGNLHTDRWWESGRARIYDNTTPAATFAIMLDHDGRTDLVSSGNTVAALWVVTTNEEAAAVPVDERLWLPSIPEPPSFLPATMTIRAVRAPLWTVPQ